MPPDIISGESSGGKHLKFVLEVNPPNVHIVPKVLGLHLSTFSLKGAHDDAQLLGSCKCHCCTGIGFFKLSKDFLLREFFHTPAPTVRFDSIVVLAEGRRS